MKSINSKKDYELALLKIDELMIKVGKDLNYENPDFVMMDRLSELVADYEDKYYNIEKPSLINVIKLKMYEMGLNQNKLAEILGVPHPRISEYLNGKREITFDVAKKLHQHMKIDGDIILQ